MAHEMSHVRNYDIRFAMLMAVMVGSIVLLADLVRRGMIYGAFRKAKGGGRGPAQAKAVLALLAAVLSIVAPLLATIIQLAVSRQREYLADASAVELTRNPAGLISALKKLSADPTELRGASKGMQHLYIVNPFLKKKKGKDSLFSTHPSLESRIQRLESLTGANSCDRAAKLHLKAGCRGWVPPLGGEQGLAPGFQDGSATSRRSSGSAGSGQGRIPLRSWKFCSARACVRQGLGSAVEKPPEGGEQSFYIRHF